MKFQKSASWPSQRWSILTLIILKSVQLESVGGHWGLMPYRRTELVFVSLLLMKIGRQAPSLGAIPAVGSIA
jgi:hypothetical protein